LTFNIDFIPLLLTMAAFVAACSQWQRTLVQATLPML
jgi:hypothetical protein